MWTDTGDSRASYQQQLFTTTDGTVNVGHNDKLSASYHGTVSLFLQISLQHKHSTIKQVLIMFMSTHLQYQDNGQSV